MHRHFDEEINGVADRKCAVFQHVPDTYPHPFLRSPCHTRIAFNTGGGMWITREKRSFNWILVFLFSLFCTNSERFLRGNRFDGLGLLN